MKPFKRARTDEQFEYRRAEILRACEKIYREDGYAGVTMMALSELTSLTRPTLYNYYANPQEVMLDLIGNRLAVVTEDLRETFRGVEVTSVDEFTDAMTGITMRSETLYIMMPNIRLIQAGAGAESVEEFEGRVKEFVDAMREITDRLFPDAPEGAFHDFMENTAVNMIGLYPYTHPPKSASWSVSHEFDEDGFEKVASRLIHHSADFFRPRRLCTPLVSNLCRGKMVIYMLDG